MDWGPALLSVVVGPAWHTHIQMAIHRAACVVNTGEKRNRKFVYRNDPNLDRANDASKPRKRNGLIGLPLTAGPSHALV